MTREGKSHTVGSIKEETPLIIQCTKKNMEVKEREERETNLNIKGSRYGGREPGQRGRD